MAGLPKIALARLKANAGTPKSARPPLGPDVFQGADHPDANLLAAFVEKSLAERERARVLNHLVRCADCREIAAFTLPAEAVEAEAASVGAGRGWSPWPVLRWGAMAAVLGTLTLIVVLHPGTWKGHPEISQQTHPPVPGANIPSTPAVESAPPLAQPPTESVKAKAEASVPTGKPVVVKKAPEEQKELARDEYAARAKAKSQVTLMAATRTPTTIRAENVPGMNIERQEGKGATALTAAASPAPPPPPAPAAEVTIASEDAAKTSAQAQAGPAAAFHSSNQRVAVTAASGGVIAGEGGPEPPRPAPKVTAQASSRMMAPASGDMVPPFRKNAKVANGPPSALWIVASSGKVQRSTDGGKSFAEVQVAHGIKFRAIAALDNEVWTGGAHGALYHSVDGGATWNRAAINIEGTTMTETITGIQLRDPQHLTVTTASGSQWVSEDGGQKWQKQP